MNIKLIIGLGNPDPEYHRTYHNVGHQFIDVLVNKEQRTALHQSKHGTGQAHGAKLLKTDAYMNESGLFVKQALKKYTVKPENLLVVHDDSDITIGNMKLSFARNSGGHKGVQNIIHHLKTNAFWRLRIGIRPAREMRREKAEQLVLRTITAADQKKITSVLQDALRAIE